MILIRNKTKRLATILVALTTAVYSASAQQMNETAKPSLEVLLKVYKSPTCGCCEKWMSHLDNNGFKTIGHNTQDMSILKDEKGVPVDYRSCHTGVSKYGYIFEGHVPAKFIAKFLEERPAGAIGLTVPGMPIGSPGMEHQDKFDAYEILQIMRDGSVSSYAKVNTFEEQF
ncbi:MAG: DUF411 domain-containing protein [Proteobacteria bacterium]|nr:DUF411 domain-containing protein [Pseudomonadota bacterium]